MSYILNAFNKAAYSYFRTRKRTKTPRLFALLYASDSVLEDINGSELKSEV